MCILVEGERTLKNKPVVFGAPDANMEKKKERQGALSKLTLLENLRVEIRDCELQKTNECFWRGQW